LDLFFFKLACLRLQVFDHGVTQLKGELVDQGVIEDEQDEKGFEGVVEV
jgi:hypothetical protein